MIHNPKSLTQIQYWDWDDKLLGVLRIPRSITGDARVLVDMFTQANLVHPDLRARGDPWADERAAKRAQAWRDYPRRRLYAVETIIPAVTAEGQIYISDGEIQILHHEVAFYPAEYLETSSRAGFHPMQKEGE